MTQASRWCSRAGAAVTGAILTLTLAGPGLAQTGAPASPPALGALPESYPWVRLAEALMPAVVNVRTVAEARRTPTAVPEPFRRFMPQDPREGRGERRGLGSGFVIDASGYIVTNHHVVDGASSIEVALADGRTLPGKVVGSDAETDLALLKIDATGLPIIPLGSSHDLKVAEPVMAIGNPFGLDHTVTVGIISGTGRVIGASRYDDFLQTDAAINPGNSGGPLISVRGEVVGIADAIVSGPTGGSRGIGFAIPIDLAKPILQQLRVSGKVIRGWLGVTIQPLTPELAQSFGLPGTHGALVASVTEDSPAARADIRPGDVVVGYDGKPVDSPRTLPPLVANTPVGQPVAVELWRDGQRQTTQVTVGNLADSREARPAAPSDNRVTRRFGLALQELTPELAQRLGVQGDKGVVVTEVRPDSPAAQAGLAPGDVIREINRMPVQGLDDVEKSMGRAPADSKAILLRVEREGTQRYVVLGAG